MTTTTTNEANTAPTKKTVLVTGAAGFVGRQVVKALAGDDDVNVVATDLRPVSRRDQLEGVTYETLDICADDMAPLFASLDVDVVVHLAAIVTPTKDTTRDLQHKVDVEGTQAVLDACVAADVDQFIYTSSGAAYGYHADAPALLQEEDLLRGNDVFAYSCHKREVEEMLARVRVEHPQLQQLIFRVSSVLGPDVNNQITAMFERPVVVGLKESDTPFCFIDADDVAQVIVKGVHEGSAGIFNLAADGVMTLREIADAMGNKYVALPEKLVQGALGLMQKFDAAPYGPEQTLFLKHRPVLDNSRLKTEFGFTPSGTSREVFARYRDARLSAGR